MIYSGHTHAYTQYGANFVHRVSIRIPTDILQHSPRGYFIRYFLHQLVGELFHTFWRAAHTYELKTKHKSSY